MASNKIRLITFDVTNTLLKFRNTPGRQYVKMAALYGFKISDKSIQKDFIDCYKMLSNQAPNFGRHSTITWQEWWKQVVRCTFQKHSLDEEAIDKIAVHLIDEYTNRESWIVAKGSFEILKCLRERKYTLGVISNFDPRLNTILKNMALDKYFDFILTSYEAGYAKPDTRIFSKALSISNLEEIMPQEALHIGDNVKYDYAGATASGWNAIVVGANKVEQELLFSANEHCRIFCSNLDELRNMIIKNNNIDKFI